MGLTITAQPALEPLTADEAKLHCRIDDEDGVLDDEFDSFIKAARRYVEKVTWRQLVTATYVLRLDSVPCEGVLYVPRPPLISVTSITYLDLEGDSQTWSTADYEVDIYNHPGRIRPVTNSWWPSLGDYQNALTVTYQAGYGATAASVPEELRVAIKMLVAHWFKQKEAVGAANMKTVPLAVGHLIAPYRLHDERVREYIL